MGLDGSDASTAQVMELADATAEGFEVSPQQRRTWLHESEGGSLRAQAIVEIEGAIDGAEVKRAIEHVVARHEILRTTFRRVPGRVVPIQVIQDVAAINWREIDIAASTLGREDRIKEFSSQQIDAPVDLAKGPITSAWLLRLGLDRSTLLVCLPAMCADVPTLGMITREIAAFLGGNPSQTDPLQYADIADWQNQLLESQTAADPGYAFWKQQAGDDPPVTLPFEKSPDPGPFRAGHVGSEISLALTVELTRVANEQGVPVSAILAGLWQALLSRYAGAWDLVLHHVTDGRPEAELEDCLGPLAGRLPISVAVDSMSPATRMWRRIAKASQEAGTWQHSFHLGAASSAPAEARAPQFGFSFEFAGESDRWPAGKVTLHLASAVCYSEPFKLELRCVATAETIGLTLHYDSRRFCASDMAHVLGCYVELVTSALSAPDSSIGSLNILPGSAWRQIVTDWNDTSRSFACSPSVHSLFEGWVKRTPSAPALVFEDKSLTYGELNILANQLAHHLKKQGVGKDICVGLCVERSLEMIVGLLGIMKAGGAYVPLDPSLPVDRLSGMLADSGARLVVSHSSVCVDLSAPTILLDSPGLAQESVQNLPSEDLSGSLVYVIYTSGSTGKPKGVGIEHRNLFNYVLGIGERLGLEPGASYATVSTIGADLGNTSVFGALCWGGCLHVVSQDRSMDSASWAEYMNTHKVDCLKIVPSHLSALLSSSPSGASLLPKQVLVLGGEASRWDLVERIGELSASLRVFNHYGPTETTVGVLTYPVTAGSKEASGCSTVPLGRPLANSRVYVLNDQLSVCPVGVAGELYIGGAGVGRGYLGREDLTQERFISDPFVSGGRVYKTGDLCRWLSDGSIEFLGRRDDQVKVRGFRIELGEIESVLLSHSGVREAVVVVLGDDQVEKRLACYVVARDRSVDTSDLKSYLKGKLPEYMVPGFMGVLPRLPLTSNGKVDRTALPAPEELSEGVGNVGARTDVERVLVGIWSEVLRVDEVGVTCNFFDLGGHSLLATQVISRVREAFQVDVPLRALFEAPTIEQLATNLLQNDDTREQIESMAAMIVSLSGLSEDELIARLSALSADGCAA